MAGADLSLAARRCASSVVTRTRFRWGTTRRRSRRLSSLPGSLSGSQTGCRCKAQTWGLCRRKRATSCGTWRAHVSARRPKQKPSSNAAGSWHHIDARGPTSPVIQRYIRDGSGRTPACPQECRRNPNACGHGEFVVGRCGRRRAGDRHLTARCAPCARTVAVRSRACCFGALVVSSSLLPPTVIVRLCNQASYRLPHCSGGFVPAKSDLRVAPSTAGGSSRRHTFLSVLRDVVLFVRRRPTPRSAGPPASWRGVALVIGVVRFNMNLYSPSISSMGTALISG